MMMFTLCRDIYLKKIERRVTEYRIEEITPFRDGKKLLVLDIDYTLFGNSFYYILVQSPVALLTVYDNVLIYL